MGGLINFRYHIISLTAVFLAIGLGVALGATVVDRALVSGLEDQLNRVESRADGVATQNERLETDLGGWEAFGEQAGNDLVGGRLAGVPVLVVTVAGVDPDVVARVEDALATAGANLQGELSLTSRFALSDSAATAELSRLVGATTTEPTRVRADAFSRMAESWAGQGPAGLLAGLVNADFVETRPAVPGAALDISVLPAPGSRFLLVSSTDADLPNPANLSVLAAQLAEEGLPVVAADLDEPDAGSERASAEPSFVSPLRADEETRGRLSSVDGAAGFRGRVAVVLALVEVGSARVGHYGTGPQAQRQLPAPA